MSYASDEEVEALLGAFLDHTLPKSGWTHGAHFAAAIGLIARHGEAALPERRAAICACNVATGGENSDTAGYHETITAASLAIAGAHLAAHPGAPRMPASTACSLVPAAIRAGSSRAGPGRISSPPSPGAAGSRQAFSSCRNEALALRKGWSSPRASASMTGKREGTSSWISA